MPKQVKRVYMGDHVFKELIAMDEAPARETGEEDDSPTTFADLHAALDEAQEHLEAARKAIKSGQDAGGDKSFSFDSVKRRVANARDCMDRLEGHLGGKRGAAGEDEESRATAYEQSRDGQVDHRLDFAPGGADAARCIAFDHDQMTGRPRLPAPRPTLAQQQRRAQVSPLVGEIFSTGTHSAGTSE